MPQPQPTEVTPPPQSNTEIPISATVTETKPSKIAFVRNYNDYYGWDIFTANADGSDIVEITNSPGEDLWPSWSPDGIQIAFYSHKYGIAIMDADGKNIKSIDTWGYYPAWSPDGTTIAYSTDRLGAMDIFTMNTDGSNKQPVAPIRVTPTTGAGASQLCASWFPDSRKIACASNCEGPWEICEVSIGNPVPGLLMPDTSESKRYNICINNIYGLTVPYNTKSFGFPTLSVSPDGKFIVFDYGRQIGKQDIYLFSIETNELKCLTCELLNNSYFPTWSPDGSKIAFTLEKDGNTDIYVMNSDGSNPTLLIKDGMFPSWQRRK